MALLLIACAAGAVAAEIPGFEETDEFGWLENDSDPAVQRWTAAQEAAARKVLGELPGRDRVRASLQDWNLVGGVSQTALRGRKFFYLKRSGVENGPSLYAQDAPRGEPRLLVDMNAASPDGRTALSCFFPSYDGLLVAYGLSTDGETVLHVKEADSGALLPDAVRHLGETSVAWRADRSGFFYSKGPLVYFHRLGGDALKDELVFGRGRDPLEKVDLSVSRNGRYLLATVRKSPDRSELHLRNLEAESTGFVEVASGEDASFRGEVEGDTLYVLTDEDAPRGRIMAVTLKMPFTVMGFSIVTAARRKAFWKTLVPEGPFTLTGFSLSGGQIAVSALERGHSRLRLYGLDGRPRREIPLPGAGTVTSLSGEPRSRTLAFTYESTLTPPGLYGFDVETSSATEVDVPPFPEALAEFESSQATYESKDAAPVTMLLAHKKRLRKNADNPALLWGCGSSGGSATPRFDPIVLAFLDRGGLYAVPNVRGGGEYGREWRRAGLRQKKQAAFDDFIAAGLWLSREKLTRPRRLAAAGCPGPLVAAALTQAPELFQAALAESPLVDMLRFDRFPGGTALVSEYGSPEDPPTYALLRSWSPYQRINPLAAYPALLAAGPGSPHARKLVAALQQDALSGLPALYLPAAAGDQPFDRILNEETDELSFLLAQLGVSP